MPTAALPQSSTAPGPAGRQPPCGRLLAGLLVGWLAVALSPAANGQQSPAAPVSGQQTRFTPTDAPAAVIKAVGARLEKQLRLRQPVQAVRTTPIAGLFEVFADGRIYYTTALGDWLVDGVMVDTARMVNYTQQRIDQLTGSVIDVTALPLRDAIKQVRGSGARTLITFEDPNCVFCQRLVAEKHRLTDVTIYTFQLSFRQSLDKNRAIWCARDRAAAWAAVLAGGTVPPAPADCDASALQRNMALARSLQLTATPVLVTAAGTRWEGYLPAEQLDALLAR